MWAFLLFFGFPIVCVIPLLLIRRSLSKKQMELDGKQFGIWFQKAYMGMDVDDQAVSEVIPGGKKTAAPAERGQRSA